MVDKKLSIGIRIESCSPVHTWFTIFSNMIPFEQDHAQATRARTGEAICMRNEEFLAFMRRVKPDVYSLSSIVDRDDVQECVGLELEFIPMNDYFDHVFLQEKKVTRS